MRDIDTRTLQNQLKDTQIELSKCTDEALREVYMQNIRTLASELLYRWRSDMQTLMG